MRTRSFTILLAAASALVLGPGSAWTQAVPTKLLVRVTAHDAKIIGSGVGGAKVIVRDLATGEVLAEGKQEGSTGNTQSIMVEPWARGGTVYATEGAAHFLAELPIEEPTMIEVVAEGPLGTPHAIQRASKTMLMVPGMDVVGEGIILELMGFTVVLVGPDSGGAVQAGREFEVRAEVTMLCGCPFEPGGMWDADRIQVTARLFRDGHEVVGTDLTYAGVRNTFAGTVRLEESGQYELQVLTMDPERGNFGMVERELTVAERW